MDPKEKNWPEGVESKLANKNAEGDFDITTIPTSLPN